jgi:hypothetical protein
MRIRHVMLTSILSSVLTVAAIIGLLACTGSVIAQKGDPPADPNEAPVVAPAEGDPNTPAAQGAQALPEEDQPEAATQYQHVAGSAFVPLYADSGVTYGSKGCTYMTSATHLFMNYSLDLPDDSTVTYLRLYFNDTAATDGTLHLAEYDDGASYTYLATVETSGSAGLGSSTVSGLNIPLDYVNYNYVLYWMPGVSGSTMQLCGYRVGFTPPIGRIQLLPTSLLNVSP